MGQEKHMKTQEILFNSSVELKTANMATVNKYDNLRKEAAEKRRILAEENKENLMGLSSVIAVKTETNQWTRQQNHEKHLRIIQWVTGVNAARKSMDNQWNSPLDWRMVTERTVHKYIPFKTTTLTQAFDYVISKMAQFGKPNTTRSLVDEDTPLWYLSRNTARRALKRAAARHGGFLRIEIPGATFSPGH